MKSLPHIVVALFALLALTGCLEVDTVLKLKADGSGTIEETVILSKPALAQINQAIAEAAGGPGTAKPFEPLDEAKLKEGAPRLGEGVTFISAVKINDARGEGFTATYAFTDIEKLKIEQNPAASLNTMRTLPGSTINGEGIPLRFRLKRGTPGALLIQLTQPKIAPKKDQPPIAETAIQGMMQTMKDMKLRFVVELPGAIAETTAKYHEGQRVTLMDLDMNKLIADPAKFREMAKTQPQSFQEVQEFMKNIDDMKMETATVVTISFQ